MTKVKIHFKTQIKCLEERKESTDDQTKNTFQDMDKSI